ncbi:hypothetical protein WISP_102984 [Willisornis vidua]|uniref:Uncharacterized protein n=1 Tax=Willisornis vidua TaxID=1566151 RepID=A0ABQ9D419_9PASS|nr:hypothetical protein WISP_102984 [Willisornis vidua]
MQEVENAQLAQEKYRSAGGIRYDPKTDTWTMVAPLSMPRDAVGVCLLGDKLYAVGGYDGQTYLNTMEAYDPQTNEWTQPKRGVNIFKEAALQASRSVKKEGKEVHQAPEIPLQPIVKTTVRQVIPLLHMEVHDVVEIHMVPMMDPKLERLNA